MSISRVIQQAWQHQSWWLICLRPLSWLYWVGYRLNRALFEMGVKRAYKSPVPVLVIGNITVGGSGKTPLLIQLVKFLQQHQIRVGVISRGYGGRAKQATLVYPHSLAEDVGDEPSLIVQSTGVPMAVSPNRQENIELLLQHYDLQLIISDDGLQHFALQREIEWIVLDSVRGLGNRKLLPEGFLREPVDRLNQATVIEHHPQSQHALNMKLAVGQPYLLQQSLSKTFNPHQSFHAVVGIGYPERFYRTLSDLGVRQFHQHSFADHHQYQWSDIDFRDGLPLITTEKDAVKLRTLLQQYQHDTIPEIWVVPVEAQLSTACYSLLAEQLATYHITIHL